MKSAPADPDEDTTTHWPRCRGRHGGKENASRSRALSSRAEAGRSRLNKSVDHYVKDLYNPL